MLLGTLAVTAAGADPAPPEVTASASVTTAGSIEVAWTAVAGAVPYGLRGVPVIAAVEVDGTQMTVTWTPAAANGRPVTAYTITLSPTVGQEVVVAGNQTSAIIEGLTAGADHTVSVRATNLRGQGEPAQSDTISVPAAPTSGTARSGAPQVVFTSTGGPCAGGVTASGTEAAEGDAPAVRPVPETAAPAPAPEAAAPDTTVEVPAEPAGRSWRWVWAALAVLVAGVVGVAVVQQRTRARSASGTPAR